MNIREELARSIKGDVADDTETLAVHSHDTSIFERTPSLVVFPKDADDVSAAVRVVAEAKKNGESVSITGRAAGTCMSGGSLTDSIVLSFTKYMNRMTAVGDDFASAEPGMYYRDFEKETMAKIGMLLPSYPASREICAIGGIVNNNSGGELTLRYGKTERFIQELDVVLSDGSRATLKPLTTAELEEKKKQQTLEGSIYRDISTLIEENKEVIAAAKPNVTKNSAGYSLWNVVDEKRGTFDLTQLIAGSQGTLALTTRAQLKLQKPKEHHAMLVIFLSDLKLLPEIVKRVLSFSPESFESYDDHTFKLAIKFGFDFLKHLGLWQSIKLAFSFLPEVRMVFVSGVPKLVLLAEFAENSDEAAQRQANHARAALADLPVSTQIALGTMEKKYWKIRRESFALLRKHMKGLHAAPFIDDLVVHPSDYPTFLPELSELLGHYDIIYTIAGHIGDGNFHIIPLVDLGNPKHRQTIMELSPKVYELVAKYKGSTTGEHGDGIIRTPFLHHMYSKKVLDLFTETKRIFDPQNIFNPGKKVGMTLEDIERFMIKTHKVS